MIYDELSPHFTTPSRERLSFRSGGAPEPESVGARSMETLNQIIEYIVRNGVMKDMSVLQEPPFTDRGSIVEVFTDLSVWLGIKTVIDKINANAAA